MAATPRFPTLSQLRASDYSYFGQLGSYLQKISKGQSALEELAPHPPYQPHTYTTTFDIDP